MKMRLKTPAAVRQACGSTGSASGSSKLRGKWLFGTVGCLADLLEKIEQIAGDHLREDSHGPERKICLAVLDERQILLCEPSD